MLKLQENDDDPYVGDSGDFPTDVPDNGGAEDEGDKDIIVEDDDGNGNEK